MLSLSHPLIFIRHGQTDWNREGRLQGGQDIPINSTGIWQATRNGRRLKGFFEEGEFNLEDFTFVTSPLGRCVHTMGLVRQGLELDPDNGFALDDRLKEITFGQWEGRTFEDLEASDPDALATREANKWSFVPPGGESYEILSQRIRPWLESLDRPTIAVSHGGVSRVMRGLLFDLDTEETPRLDVPQDKIYLVHEGQGFWL